MGTRSQQLIWIRSCERSPRACSSKHTGEYIIEALTSKSTAVRFGVYAKTNAYSVIMNSLIQPLCFQLPDQSRLWTQLTVLSSHIAPDAQWADAVLTDRFLAFARSIS